MFNLLPLLAAIPMPVHAPPAGTTPGPVTTATLIAQAGDLAQLTRHPGAGVRVVQFSSYDRRSGVPGGPEWFGNDDGFGGEPIPNFEGVIKQPGPDGIGEYLICDVQQPGAIVRTWTAAIEGTIRVYLDGASTPLYDGPAQDFLMHKTSALAKAAGLDPEAAPDLLAGFEQRYADYFPIVFARSCRIVWAGGLNQVHFYHVQVRQYPPGTAMQTFEAGDLKKWHRTAADMGKQLREHRTGDGTWVDMAHSQVGNTTVEPGQTAQCGKLDGPGQISELQVKVTAADQVAALRGTVLRVHFDGAQTPQIASPIGDFFGAAPGIVPYDTLPMSVHPDGTMTCRFPMPYSRSAVITAQNTTDAPVTITLSATHDSYTWDDRSMHFHARWRADHDLLARGGKDAIDLPFLSAHGRGLYVGTAVYITSPCPVPTAGGNWWGEGDEKVFVDDEPRPSIFGTGSEDYFNYAWSESDIFQYPYFSQPICTGPETRGYITNNRWHILDAIPFDRSISFSMELFAHTPTPHLSYCRTSYWYATPGSHDDAQAIDESDLRVPPLPSWTVRAAGGASGAAIFEAETARDPTSLVNIVQMPRYSSGGLARFIGPSATIHVKLETAGRYMVVLTCASGPEPVLFTAAIDGTPLKIGDQPAVELRTPHIERLVNLRCAPVELTAGEHLIHLQDIDGPSGLGVDFVWLRPVK